MSYAVIDIGSNTVRMNVYKYDGKLTLLFSKKKVLGLGSYIKNDNLDVKGEKKLIDAIKQFRQILVSIPVDSVSIFATASLRKVENYQNIIHSVKEATDFHIDLIGEKKEARLGFNGVKELFDIEKGLTVDIGGGSTEVSVIKDGEISEIYNLDEGSLSLWNTFVTEIIPNKQEISKMSDLVDKKIKNFNTNKEDFPEMIGIGGTIRAAGRVAKDVNGLNNRRFFNVDQVREIYKNVAMEETQIMRSVVQNIPERLHTILPGMLILIKICDRFGVKKISVSDFGIREGYLLNKLWR